MKQRTFRKHIVISTFLPVDLEIDEVNVDYIIVG